MAFGQVRRFHEAFTIRPYSPHILVQRIDTGSARGTKLPPGVGLSDNDSFEFVDSTDFDLNLEVDTP